VRGIESAGKVMDEDVMRRVCAAWDCQLHAIIHEVV